MYTKVGRMVTVHMEVSVSTTNSGSGSVVIGGDPLTGGNELYPTRKGGRGGGG